MSQLLARAQGAAVTAFGSGLLTSLLLTCRFSVSGAENYRRLVNAGKPVIFVLWHGRLLPCTFRHRGQGLVTLISQHRDGEYIARIVRRWGFTAVRGSSSRGASPAFRQLLRHVRAGRSVAITPDGPRGPREVMKPGALALAQLSGAPVIPVLAGADRAWWFGGWDRFLVPRPFARVRMAYGAPVWVPRESEPGMLEAVAGEIESRLAEIMRTVDAVGER